MSLDLQRTPRGHAARAAVCSERMSAARRSALRCMVLAAASVLHPVGASTPGAATPPELDVPYVTTPDNVVDAMLDIASVGPGDRLIDLGSGDGRIPITAARRWGTPGLGVDIDPSLVSESRRLAHAAGVADRVRFLEQDLFETDLSQATVITMYLLPDVNMKLRPSLARLAPGVRIVSHDWDLGDWLADATRVVAAPSKTMGLRKESIVRLWVVPADVGGMHAGPGMRLSLEQQWQQVRGGVLALSGVDYRVLPAVIQGGRVAFEAVSRDGRRVRLSSTFDRQPAGLPIAWVLEAPGVPARRIETRRGPR